MDSANSLQDALVDEIESLYKEVNQLARTDALPETALQLLRGLVSVSQYVAQQTAKQHSSGGAMLAEVTALKDEVERLKSVNAAYDKQIQWLKDRIALSRNTTGQLRLKATLKQTLDAAVGITRADSGSIFLIDANQVVTESILARQGTTEDERHSLVGTVLEKGLAGWVTQRQTTALVSDTRLDDRWISLPDQPYKVASALCVPLLRGDRVFGVLTLTHPEAKYFNQQDSDLVTAIAYQIALLLENSDLSDANQDYRERLQHSQDFFRQLLKTPLVGAFLLQDNKFIHVNKKLAALFGYPREELTRLPSIASLLAYEDRDRVYAAIHECLSGKSALLSLSFRISNEQGQVINVSTQAITTEYHGQLALVGMMGEDNSLLIQD
ncbi:MAG: GAF domain-containing protein [Cyanobacteria bacterium J06554_6]